MNKARYMTLFMHVVSSGSITNAAEKLDVSKSVVSHQLKLLEQELGVTLLKRTTRKQQLTSAGEAFYQDCCELYNITESAWLQAKEAQQAPQGRLKISAPHALMNSLIIPALGKAFRDNNQLKLDLISSDEHQDLMHEDIDLAIRVGFSQASNLKQKRLGRFRDQLCQSRRYPLLNNPSPQVLEQTAYIANAWQGKHIQHQVSAINEDAKIKLSFTKVHQANNLQSCIELIEQGFGIGIVPDFICRRYKDTLISAQPDLQLEETPIYALHPYQGATPIAIKVAISHIEDALTYL